MSIGCLSTQNVDAKIKPKLIFLNTRLCRQKRMINLREFYSYPTDNGSRQAAGELKAPVMTGSGAQREHVTLLTDFRSPSQNGHSRYGHLTARFAPFRTMRWIRVG
jgi:hypothetical protein